MREIGSEFWDVPISRKENHLFPEKAQWYLSGRGALKAIIADLEKGQSVAMPSWCCDSMIKPFVDAGMEVRFYPVFRREGLTADYPLNSDVLFLMDYFGYSSAMPVPSAYEGITIRDVTHSIFSSSHSDAAYTFGSLRKWCGVWTGGYAWTSDGHALPAGQEEDHGYTVLRKQAMEEKAAYISGVLRTDGNEEADKSFRKIFEAAEERLEHTGIVPGAARDVAFAKKMDVQEIRTRRRSNAALLRAAFPEWLVFPELKETDCPMFVPILVPDGKRDALRQFLIVNQIYCPIHWPVSSLHQRDEDTAYLYENELSLVCDQRYTESDMKRMIETIERFWKET